MNFKSEEPMIRTLFIQLHSDKNILLFFQNHHSIVLIGALYFEAILNTIKLKNNELILLTLLCLLFIGRLSVSANTFIS